MRSEDSAAEPAAITPYRSPDAISASQSASPSSKSAVSSHPSLPRVGDPQRRDGDALHAELAHPQVPEREVAVGHRRQDVARRGPPQAQAAHRPGEVGDRDAAVGRQVAAQPRQVARTVGADHEPVLGHPRHRDVRPDPTSNVEQQRIGHRAHRPIDVAGHHPSRGTLRPQGRAPRSGSTPSCRTRRRAPARRGARRSRSATSSANSTRREEGPWRHPPGGRSPRTIADVPTPRCRRTPRPVRAGVARTG